MRKTLKYLLITCVILGAPAYAMDERILDPSSLPTSSLTAQWFGTAANYVRVSDLDLFLLEREQAIRQQRAQAQRELDAANAARDVLQRDSVLALKAEEERMAQALEAQEERMAQALEAQKQESSRVLEEFRRRAEEERPIMLASLKNQQRLLDVQQREQDALLMAKEGAEGDAMRQKRRAEKLEQTVREKEAMIEPLKKLESELRDLIKEKERLAEQLEDALGKAEKNADLIGRLQAGVEETRSKEQRLRQEIEHLQKEQAEKEALIARYQQAQRAGDYYTYLLDLINDRSVSDEELTKQIYAVMLRSGKSLDDLHPTSGQSLASLLRQASRPTDDAYQAAGKEKSDTEHSYHTRVRLIGNQIRPLGWGAPPRLIQFRGSAMESAFTQVTTQLVSGASRGKR